VNKRAVKNNKRRILYQLKRSGWRYFSERERRLRRWKSGGEYRVSTNKYTTIENLESPTNLSFIDNTEGVLEYLKSAAKYAQVFQPIRFDISNITSLTPETIPLLLSHITSLGYNKRVAIYGNSPNNENFRKLFTESGFFDHVRSKVNPTAREKNLMHKETFYIVKPDIAAKALALATANLNYDEDKMESVYNIFVELMSNTHHHASLEKYGDVRWWLYVYSNPDTGLNSVSFLDLGVGIFKSLIVKNYLVSIGKKLNLIKNIDYVDDLISGKIQSRIEIDKKMRGKGIPQIVQYSSLDHFRKFYIITNDIKLDLKGKTKLQLKNSFKGTFYYFELA